LLLLAGLAAAQQPSELVRKFAGISEYRLANGLQVLLYPYSGATEVTVSVTYLAGSKRDNYGETGEAHLLEHMMFRGSQNHPNLYREFTNHGIEPSDTSGATTLDRTSYFETVPSSEPELEWALDMEADRMANSLLRQADLDAERSVVLNELAIHESDVSSVLMQRVHSTAFQLHNYAKPVLGTANDLGNVSADHLRLFYKMFYRPDNAVVLVAGKFDAEGALGLITRTFGRIQAPARPQWPSLTVEPPQDGERVVKLEAPAAVASLIAAYHVPAAFHPDSTAVQVLAFALAGPGFEKLSKHIGSRQGTAMYTSSAPEHDPFLLTFLVAGAKGGSADELHSQVDEALRLAIAEDMTQAELERAKAALLTDFDTVLRSPRKTAAALPDSIALGDWRALWLRRERVKAVTLDDLRRVTAAYLKPSNRTTGLLIPVEKPDISTVPEASDASGALASLKDQAVVGAVFDASSANIDAQLIRSRLPAGIKIGILKKQSDGDMVSAVVTLRFGAASNEAKRAAVGRLAGRMLMEGTTEHDHTQTLEDLSQWKSYVNVSGGAHSVVVSIKCPVEFVPQVFGRVREILRDPLFEEGRFGATQRKVLTEMDTAFTQPQALAAASLARRIEPDREGDAQPQPTVAEQIAAIGAVTVAQVRAFHAEMYGASDGEIAVVGPVEPGPIKGLLSDLFGDWPAPARYQAPRPRDAARIPAPSRDVIVTPNKPNAVLLAGLWLPFGVEDGEYPALLVGNEALGGGFLNSRFATRLRQQGLSYIIRSVMVAAPVEREAVFTIFATFAPSDRARAETAVTEELRRAEADGFSTEELSGAKASLLEQLKLSHASDSALATLIASKLETGRTFQTDESLRDKIASVTSGQVTAALRRYLAPEKLSIVAAGDFPK